MNPERQIIEPQKSMGADFALPESFRNAVEKMKPDGLDWQRIEAAIDVLKGEKVAIAPKPSEPEPTDGQKFWRDMYRSGKLSPYQKDRPGIKMTTVAEAWKNPQSQGVESKIMAVDLAIRGGADKEYNQLGDMPRRVKRMGAMVGNMIPNITFDIVTSLPYNLGEKVIDEVLKGRLEQANFLSEDNQDKKSLIKTIERQRNIVKAANRLGEVYNDKDVTARGDKIMQDRTGEHGWFTGESSDKLNDLLTAGFKEYIEDFVNGPTIESAFRIVYQIPVVGALVEQGWTRWTNFQSKNAFNKGRLKAVYASVGMLIGLMRDADHKKRWTPSALITDGIWNGGAWVVRTIKGQPPNTK